MISPAIRECSPVLSAAMSPASPWRYTPRIDASRGGRFCPVRDAIMPVRTSPVPAVAMPGFPVLLIKTRPSGDATMVGEIPSARYNSPYLLKLSLQSLSGYPLRYLALSSDGRGFGVRVKKDDILSSYPPPLNPLPPGEGELGFFTNSSIMISRKRKF